MHLHVYVWQHSFRCEYRISREAYASLPPYAKHILNLLLIVYKVWRIDFGAQLILITSLIKVRYKSRVD